MKNVLLFCAVLLSEILLAVHGYREFMVDGVRTILTLENEIVNIHCDTDSQMTYCGFVHPNGKRFSFSGQGLIAGHCSIERNVTKDDSGEWKCHIGKKSVGMEVTDRINVRIVNKVAAVQPNLTVVHGDQITLACATTETRKPLSYCRFEPPFGEPFSIASVVKSSNALLNQYYYPHNMSLDRGDCAIVIKTIKYKDVGVWTCGAGLDDGQEYIDTITVQVQGLYTMSKASVTGVTFGVIAIIILLGLLGLIAWKKRHILGTVNVQQESIEIQEMGAVSRSQHRSPKRSPKSGRVMPSVMVQSPSPSPEPSTSPLVPTV